MMTFYYIFMLNNNVKEFIFLYFQRKLKKKLEKL